MERTQAKVYLRAGPTPLLQHTDNFTLSHMAFSPSLFFHLTLVLVLSTLVSSSALPGSLPSTKQISADVFTCDSSNELLNAICQVGLRKINADLEEAGVSVDRDGILFTWEDPKDITIDTGHSCTVTAKVTNQKATAGITSAARLKFSGNSLTEPFAIRLQIPVVVTARIDVKQRFGVRIIGSCSNTGSDSYAFTATLTTTADAMVGLYFNPSLGMLDSGDYGLVVEPKVAVVSQIRNPVFRFRVSGVSPLTSIWTFVHGFGSTLFKSVTALFTGGSAIDVLRQSAGFDILVPIVLGVGALPRPLEAAIWDRLFKIDQHSVLKKSMGFGNDIEEKLQADLARALKLQRNGKRVFIIKKDVIEQIRKFGVGADVFIEPPVNPAIACEERSKRVCQSTELQVIYDECFPLQRECQRLQREYDDKYSPSSVIVSKPRVASLPPPPTNPPVTQPPTTRRPFTTGCISTPGREVDC